MAENYLKVIENKHFLRHANSKGIVNTDNDGLKKYREERDKMKRLNSLAEQQDKLGQEINDIKTMLQQILQKIEK
jgi:hypothetical protein